MHEFTLDVAVEDMDEGDLRSTLDEFMQKHEENVSDYEELEAEYSETGEKVEELEGEISEYSDTHEALTAKFAEIVAEDSPLFDAEEVAERFSLDELLTKADAIGVFSQPEVPADDGDEPEGDEPEGTTFSDKPDKAAIAEQQSEYRSQAEADLKTVLGGGF